MLSLAAILPFPGAGAAEVPARILAFEAVPRSVKAGEAVELRWVAKDATRVRLDPSGEEFPAEGRTIRVLGQNTVFWLHAINATGGQSVPLMIEVRPALASAQGETGLRTTVPGPSETPQGSWIQFAALADGTRALGLKESLEALLGHSVHLSRVESPHRPGLTLHRIRMGPFVSRGEAKLRLKEIASRIRPLRLKAWISED